MLYPPTCVGFGTGSNRLPRGFSWKYGLTHFTQLLRPTPQLTRSAFYNFSTYVSSRGRPEPRLATLLRHPIGDNALLEGQEFLPVVHRLRLPALP